MSQSIRGGTGTLPNAAKAPVEEPEPHAARDQARAHPRFVLGVTIVFALLTAAPYALAVWRAPDGYRFNGVLLNHFDQNYYQAAQRSTAHDLPQRNRFTTEPGAPGPISPLYPLSGSIQRLTGIPATAVYHFPRVMATLILPLLLAYLFSLCLQSREEARWALLFALFATGLMALFPGLPLASRSGERIPESNVVYSMTVFPHFAISYVGITLAFTSVAMALHRRRPWPVAAVAAASGCLLTLGHPFLLLPFLVVVAGFVVAFGLRTLVGERDFRVVALVAAAVGAVAPASAVLYNLRREQERLEQLQGFEFPTAVSDRWWTWAIGYGIVAVLAVPGVVHLVGARRRDPLLWLILGWFGAQAAFMYLPYTVFQRRFSEGLILPIAAAAGAGAALVCGQSSRTRVFRLCILSILGIGAWWTTNFMGSLGQYVSDETAELLGTVERGDIVLAGNTLSALLPAISDGTAYAARHHETIQYERKREHARRWAQNPADEGSRLWLHREGITMVIVARDDESFAPASLDDPSGTCLRTVFTGRQLKAYRPQPQCLVSKGR